MRKLVGLTMFILLVGCGGQDYAPDDYVTRLENTLSVSEPVRPLNIVAFPKPRALRIDHNATTLSIREFLSLRECKLHIVLAKRNSLMGKVANASQRLFNDLDILATGPDCVAKLDNRALAEQLQHYLYDKHSKLGFSLWRAIMGSPENRSFWRLSANTDALGLATDPELLSSLMALTLFVTRIQQGHYQFTEQDYQEIEQHLGRLRFGNGGLVYHEYARLTQSLARANGLIEQRLARPLCYQQQPTQAARYFKNVVDKVFISRVQTLAVGLTRREKELITPYLELENSLLEFAPQHYQEWVRTRSTTLALGREATHQHVRLIQQLYQQCGLAAGNRTR